MSRPGTEACIRSRSLFLRGHRCADPGRGADRGVRLPQPDRARTDGGRVQVGQAGDGDGRRREAEVLGHRRRHRPDDRPGRHERRQPRRVHPGGADQHVVVGERRQRAVVGQPGSGHRGVAGRRHAREPHRQVVDRLQQPPGPGDDVGLLVLEEEDVADGVVARDRRDPPAATQPRGQRLRRVAGDRPADGRSRVRRPAGVAPQHARSDRPTLLVDRDRGGPLAGDADGHDPREVGGPRGAAYGRRGPPATTARRPASARRRGRRASARACAPTRRSRRAP